MSKKKCKAVLGCWLLWFVGCASQPEVRVGSRSTLDCTGYVAVDCDQKNADVVVKAEVFVAQDGTGSLGRIVSVQPANHQLTADEIAQVRGRISIVTPEGPRTDLDTYAICTRPWVDIYDGCPSSAEAERKARAKGYRIRSVR